MAGLIQKKTKTPIMISQPTGTLKAKYSAIAVPWRFWQWNVTP